MTSGPHTRESLLADLQGLGVRAGDTLLLHASLRSLGWVCGGPVVVVQALLDALGPQGTLVVPTHTPENRDPSRWEAANIDSSWWPQIRAHLPAFEPAITPCPSMGLIAETVRTWPTSRRSPHPQTSFSAIGHLAAQLTSRHDLESELGEQSPLGALETVEAGVLLMGVGFERCTAFHLAEYRQPAPTPRPNACVVSTEAGRRWIDYTGICLDAGDFDRLGADFERCTPIAFGRIGGAEARLFPLRQAVSFALTWMGRNRPSRDAMEPV